MISVLSLEFHTIPGDNNTVNLKLIGSGSIELRLNQEKNVVLQLLNMSNFFNTIETLFTFKHYKCNKCNNF